MNWHCGMPRQYLIAIAAGAVAAVIATSLEVITTVSPGMMVFNLQFTVPFSLLFGAIAGAISLTAGVLTRRLLALLGARGKVPATGGAIGVLVVGVALSITVGLIPPFFPFIWVPVLASVLGAKSFYLRSLVDIRIGPKS